jgi:hypothetical protein
MLDYCNNFNIKRHKSAIIVCYVYKCMDLKGNPLLESALIF